jgi:hypothetical protein
MFSYRKRSWTPYIRKYLLQRNCGDTSGDMIGQMMALGMLVWITYVRIYFWGI